MTINSRQLAVAAVTATLLAGCKDDDGSNGKRQPEMFLSTSVAAVSPIENVQTLRLELEPVWIYADSSVKYHEEKGRSFLTRTSDDGSKQTYNPTRPAHCGTNVSTYECRFWNSGFFSLIDTSSPDPLPTLFIARNDRFTDIAITYSYLAVSLELKPIGTRPDFRGAYLHLSDGRECPITVRPNSTHYPIVPSFKFLDKENWHIKIAVDFDGTVIDPAQCGIRPYDIVWNLRSVTAERVQGML